MLIFDFCNRLLIIFEHQIENLYSFVSRDSDPLLFGVECNFIDRGVGFEFYCWFSNVVDIPNVELSILSGGSEVLLIGTDINAVDVAVVSLESISDLEVGVPDLNSSVPTDTDEEGLSDCFGGLLGERTVSNATHPVSVIVHFGGVFAVGQSVPQFDASVCSCRDDLSVIGRKLHAEYFL